LEGKERKCSPVCEFFQCGQRKLVYEQGSNNPSRVLCGWVGDPCEGCACAYSTCVKGQLRQDGDCGLLEKTTPRMTPVVPRIKREENEVNVNLMTVAKPKVLKKIKWHEI
jgi:hypothetical protein